MQNKEESKELKIIKTAIKARTQDGRLSKTGIAEIMQIIRKQYDGKKMPAADKRGMENYIQKCIVDSRNKQGVTLPEKIFAVLGIFATLITVPSFYYYAKTIKNFVDVDGFANSTINTFVIAIIACAFLGISIIAAIVTFVFMLTNRRGNASSAILVSISFTVLSNIMSLMIMGIVWDEVWIFVYLVIQVGFLIYLQPQLMAERKLSYNIQQLSTELLAKQGQLGYAEEGEKGFIKLDFFNIFWIFIFLSVCGLLGEDVFHILFIWEPGVFKDRAGTLFGPFSPIYGFGGILVTIILNRYKNSNSLAIFCAVAVIGGIFEFFVSWFLETAYGIQAWGYPDQFLNIGGRTCLAYCCIFGMFGVVWIKLVLPRFMLLINKIPWKWRYSITFVAATLMIINGLMTFIAFDCWNSRLSGNPQTTPIEQFYETNFGNDFMEHRFESMSLYPELSARSEVQDKQPQ